MNISQLRTLIALKGYPMQMFNIGSFEHSGGYTIVPQNGTWHVFYQDPGRGDRTYVQEFETEEEASVYFLQWIDSMEPQLGDEAKRSLWPRQIDN